MDLADLERAICCEGSECRHPERCYLDARSQCVPVRVDLAAKAVHALLCREWARTAQERAARAIG